MIHFLEGPQLRALVRSRCFGSEWGHASYTYVDDDGRRVPEYAATRIRIRAFHLRMSVSLLDDLERGLRSIPGCLSIERTERHATLRPQIVATFDRKATL